MRTALLLPLFMAMPLAHAAGTWQPLDWPNRQETARYRSCGCADACWIAEVHDRKRQLKARLRCDCEVVLAQIGKAPERQIAANCSAFEQGDKFDAIRRELLQLLPLPD